MVVAFTAFTCLMAMADEDTAKEFLKLGRRAISKRDYAEAVSRFEKALEEDPGLIEAQYWKAFALDRSGDKSGAIKAFRKFLASYEAKDAKGEASRSEARLEARGRRRLNSLAVWEKEFDKIERTFLSDLYKFAREYSKKDPSSARKALKSILQVCPDHTEARDFLERLGGDETEDSDLPKDSALIPGLSWMCPPGKTCSGSRSSGAKSGVSKATRSWGT